MNSDPNWAQAAQQMQTALGEGLRKALSAMPGAPVLPASGLPAAPAAPPLEFDAANVEALQQSYMVEMGCSRCAKTRRQCCRL